MNIEDVIEGEIYSNQDGDYIWKCGCGGRAYYANRISISNESYAKNSNHSWTSNIRLATPQEKEHLLQCIAANMYVNYKLTIIKFNYLIL